MIRFYLAIACLATLATTAAQDTPVRTMSLKECVIIALQQSYDLQISTLDVKIASSQARGAKGAYDPVLTTSVTFSDTTAPGGFDTRTGNFVDSQSKTTRGSVGVSGLLPTGGTYSVGASVSDTEGDSGGFPFSNASGQGPFIQLRQPLLENFAIDDARLNIQLTRQSLQISGFNLHQSMLGTISRVEDAYYDLAASRESVRVQEAALKLAEELAKDNQRRVALGASAPLEEADSQAQAATSRAAVISAKRFVRAAENNLKEAMVEDYAQWRQLGILPGSKLSKASANPDFNDSWTLAQQARPDLLAFQVQLDQQRLILQRRGNELLPQLDLTATAGLAGSADELNQVYKQIRRRDAPYYSLGLSLSLPLTNRREKENLRVAEAQAEQTKLRFRQLRQTIMIQVDDAVSRAETDFQRLAATAEAREFAEKALTNERAKLARGASTNFVVLQLQRNLTAARSEELRSLTDYNKSLARLRFIEGSSLGTYQINFTFTD